MDWGTGTYFFVALPLARWVTGVLEGVSLGEPHNFPVQCATRNYGRGKKGEEGFSAPLGSRRC